MASLYAGARQDARLGLLDHRETEAATALPADCPYDLDQLMADEWWPVSRHGLGERGRGG